MKAERATMAALFARGSAGSVSQYRRRRHCLLTAGDVVTGDPIWIRYGWGTRDAAELDGC